MALVLQDLLADNNPMVVANAVAALTEINEVSGKNVLQLDRTTQSKLLRALNECTEWGQVSAGLSPLLSSPLLHPTHLASALLGVI